MLGKAPGFMSNYVTNSDYQKFDQAKRDFVNAVLRRESGAAISQSEFDNANKQYFPQPGDTPERIAEKRKQPAGRHRRRGRRRRAELQAAVHVQPTGEMVATQNPIQGATAGCGSPSRMPTRGDHRATVQAARSNPQGNSSRGQGSHCGRRRSRRRGNPSPACRHQPGAAGGGSPGFASPEQRQ
jgi:hypothetical protein